MIGLLPTSLEVNGKEYEIRTDYRDILRIFSALNDEELSDRDKYYVLMATIYIDGASIPPEDSVAAYEAAISFMECFIRDDTPSPRTINWEKDEQLLFPAINKVAGYEVRSVPYLHWWTFLGFFQGIDRDDTWGYVLMLRQKKARGKKLEKHEKEFWTANRAMCEIDTPRTMAETTGNALNEIFSSLTKGGAD